jgi:hypothetical protein
MPNAEVDRVVEAITAAPSYTKVDQDKLVTLLAPTSRGPCSRRGSSKTSGPIQT